MGYYWDTNVFWYFMVNKEVVLTNPTEFNLLKDHELSPLKAKPAYISLFTIEEFLFNASEGKVGKTLNINKSFNEWVDDIYEFKNLFKEAEGITIDQLSVSFFDLLNKFRRLGIENNRMPKTKDLLHFIVAEKAKCSTFITSDSEFKIFGGMGQELGIKNIITIAFLDKNPCLPKTDIIL